MMLESSRLSDVSFYTDSRLPDTQSVFLLLIGPCSPLFRCAHELFTALAPNTLSLCCLLIITPPPEISLWLTASFQAGSDRGNPTSYTIAYM